ncbi:MAG: hypothetical protein AAFR73_07125 [Pseudomonadota bacterium]
MTAMDYKKRDEEARAILRGNDRGGYTIPTAGLYPYQWNWDSAFTAWGYATFDTDRAWVEIETLMSGQWPSGMVPHILFHKPDPGYFPGPDVWQGTHGPIPSSGISQPPVAATVLRSIFERDGNEERARRLFAKMKAWHGWFMDWRSDCGAIFITHPWEAGRDNAPDWDAAMAAINPVGVGEYTRRDTSHVDASMRPTKEEYDRYIWLVQQGRSVGWNDAELAKIVTLRVADPTMTFILLRANTDLIAVGNALEEDTTELEAWSTELRKGADRLLNSELGAFDAIDLATGTHTGNVSNASFLCWYGGVDDGPMLAHLDAALSNCRHPVPSHPVGAAKFDSKRYWRGPTWAFMNSMIGRGLHDMGHDDYADQIRDATRKLIAEHGFAEYFDPLTGDPAGGGMFSWTAAVWLAWASPSAEGA